MQKPGGIAKPKARGRRRNHLICAKRVESFLLLFPPFAGPATTARSQRTFRFNKRTSLRSRANLLQVPRARLRAVIFPSSISGDTVAKRERHNSRNFFLFFFRLNSRSFATDYTFSPAMISRTHPSPPSSSLVRNAKYG